MIKKKFTVVEPECQGAGSDAMLKRLVDPKAKKKPLTKKQKAAIKKSERTREKIKNTLKDAFTNPENIMDKVGDLSQLDVIGEIDQPKLEILKSEKGADAFIEMEDMELPGSDRSTTYYSRRPRYEMGEKEYTSPIFATGLTGGMPLAGTLHCPEKEESQQTPDEKLPSKLEALRDSAKELCKEYIDNMNYYNARQMLEITSAIDSLLIGAPQAL